MWATAGQDRPEMKLSPVNESYRQCRIPNNYFAIFNFMLRHNLNLFYKRSGGEGGSHNTYGHAAVTCIATDS